MKRKMPISCVQTPGKAGVQNSDTGDALAKGYIHILAKADHIIYEAEHIGSVFRSSSLAANKLFGKGLLQQSDFIFCRGATLLLDEAGRRYEYWHQMQLSRFKK